MRAVVVLLMGVVLVGCESSGVAERQTFELNRSYATCLKNEARRVDTGAAEPATVAMAIWPACSRFFTRMREAVAQGEDAGARQELDSRFRLSDLDFATKMVVEQRAERTSALR
ncbi:MAG TPA: hypothetical protein VGU20_05380 [Stellaceae bacterium]|nr:hypothetical protein [Stellaceae bacterium]